MRVLALIAVLAALAPAARGQPDPLVVIRGDRLKLSGGMLVTFWLDEEKYRLVKPEAEPRLVQGAVVKAPAGVDVETLELKVSTDVVTSRRGGRDITSRAHVIRGQFALTAGPSSALGPCELSIDLPEVAAVKQQLGAISPRATGFDIALEVFASRKDFIEGRTPKMAWRLVWAIPLALWLAALGALLVPAVQIRLRIGMALVGVPLMFAILTANAVMHDLGTLIQLLSELDRSKAILAGVLSNAWLGLWVWLVDRHGRGPRLACALICFALATASPWIAPNAGFGLNQALVGAALAGLMPAALIALWFVEADPAPPPDPEETAILSERSTEALASLGLATVGKTAGADETRVLDGLKAKLFDAYEHAHAGRAEQAVDILREVLPALAGTGSDEPLLSAATHTVHGIALEMADLKPQALERYRAALEAHAGCELARKGVLRLGG